MKYKVRVNSSIESENVKTFLLANCYLKPYGNFILLDGWVCIDEYKNILCVAKSQAGKEIYEYETVSFDELKAIVKPKEYLFKGIDGTYKVFDNDCQGRAIEIPEGAIIAVHYNRNDKIYFWKDNETHLVGEVWVSCKFNGLRTIESFLSEHKDSCIVVWQRHTQPEELPFLDDECLLDKVSKYVDDEPVDPVDSTLNQRQSQYGDFHNVAHTTQYLLQMLSNDKMSDVQLESLHMICSKLSRIAHGDPNHVDSWHDIAGYATLVVKDLS